MNREQAAGLAREVFGAGRRLIGLERLQGGSKKGVYRLSFEEGPSAVLYVWAEYEDYWPADARADAADPFGHASGLRLFEASRDCLGSIGVRVPALYFADRSRRHCPGDVAVIEDVRGGTLEELLRDDPVKGERVLDRLAVALEAMGRHRSAHVGKVAEPTARAAVEVVRGRALRDLDEAARRVGEIREVRREFEAAVREMADALEERTDYGLIHGELGPDHVLVDEDGEPVLIDIEGTMFFDVEWEYVFVGLRFDGRHYERLRPVELDQRRMRLYRLAQHLSLVAGPLRLLDGDFPAARRGPLRAIATTHTRLAREFLRGIARAREID
ncbi:phosphotransferase [Nonomuraea sp. NPDC046802]|uniref:phosphotransferase n=1 Tax=Nonomuraea sp. NPDC046802 TaxID=3154919 RepID=UPI0033C7B1B7